MTLPSQTPSTNVYNVKDMGCKGDGITDDRPILQRIINTVGALGGGTIYFPPGTYIVSRAGGNFYSLIVSLLNKITFLGERNQSFISHPTGMPAFSVAVIELDRANDITFRNMGLSGNWGNASTIVAQASNETVLPQATINVEDTTDFPAGPSTMTVISTSGAQAVTYTAKTATSFTGCAGGVGTIMRNYAVGYVDDNTGINQTDQADPRNYLIFSRGTANLTIEDCNFKQAYGDCVWLGTSNINDQLWTRNARIINCDCYMSARNGVTFGGAVVGCEIDRCTFRSIFAQAVDGEPGGYPVRDIVVSNSFLDGWWDPSHFTNGCAPLSIVGGTTNGFVALGNAAQNWRVINNDIRGATFVEYAQDVLFQGNHVIIDWAGKSFSAIAVELGCGDVEILDNFFYTRSTIAGLSDAAFGVITIFNYGAPAAKFFNPSNVQVRGNRIHCRNGRYAINLFAPGGQVQTETGVATAITATTLVKAGAGWADDVFGGCMVRLGTAEASVLSNTSDTLTLGIVDSSFPTAWQTDAGQYAPTPAVGAFTIFRIGGVVDVNDNDIDCRDDGNGNGGYGVYMTLGNGNPGMRVRIRDNKIKNAQTSGIYVDFAVATLMVLLDISDNFGFNDQPALAMTNLIQYANAPLVTKWVMRGNILGQGVTNVVTGLATGTWLVNDGNVQSWAGYGTPETVVTAPIGSIYQRLDGGAQTAFYVKISGAGNTGWVGIFPAGTVATVTNAGSPYTVLSSDVILFVDTSGGAVQLNLPNPANQGAVNSLRVIDTKGTFATANCTLHRFGAELIEGLAADKALATAWGSFVVVTDLTDWYV